MPHSVCLLVMYFSRISVWECFFVVVVVVVVNFSLKYIHSVSATFMLSSILVAARRYDCCCHPWFEPYSKVNPLSSLYATGQLLKRIRYANCNRQAIGSATLRPASASPSVEVWPYLKPRAGWPGGNPSSHSGGITFWPVHHTMRIAKWSGQYSDGIPWICVGSATCKVGF